MLIEMYLCQIKFILCQLKRFYVKCILLREKTIYLSIQPLLALWSVWATPSWRTRRSRWARISFDGYNLCIVETTLQASQRGSSRISEIKIKIYFRNLWVNSIFSSKSAAYQHFPLSSFCQNQIQIRFTYLRDKCSLMELSNGRAM